jgi:hypothetical protein
VRRPALALLVSALVGGCAGPGPAPVDAGTDAPPSDAGSSFVDYDGSWRGDGGPFLVDPGPCTGWPPLAMPGPPITGLVPGEWTWVEVPEAHCMDGTSTGFALRPSTSGIDRLVIYLEGGGACFDEATCEGTAMTAWSAENFHDVSILIDAYAIFDPARSPAADWSAVYVPYCTGDVHAGTNASGFGGRQHVGHTNVTHFLRRIIPTFPGLEQVLLTGASAGGLGALANFDQVQQAFGCTPVTMLDDSGPVLDDPYMRPCLQARTRDLWRFAVPPDCPQCTGPDGGGFVALWAYLATKYPDRRFGLLSTTRDSTIRRFYSFGLVPGCDHLGDYPPALYEEGLLDLRDFLAPYPNVHTFYWASEGHTFLPFDLTREAGGTSAETFIGQLMSGDPAWTDVGP